MGIDQRLFVALCIPAMTQEHKSCLIQPKMVIQKTIGETAVLNCSVNSNCKAVKPEWFVVKSDSYQYLKLTGKYELNEGSLHINSLNVNDTGHYLCAAAAATSNLKHYCLGEGVTLIVGGKEALDWGKIIIIQML